MILAVDTSLPVFSVALLRDRQTIGAVAMEGKQSRNEKLLPAIDWLLSEVGASISDISLFVSTRGPGSFTGVRVGLATMQGLAFATGKPLCAFSTHEAVALGSNQPDSVVFGDAMRGEIYLSVYRAGHEDLAPVLAPRVRLEEIDSDLRRIDLDAIVQRENVALMAAHRAAALLAEGRAVDRTDATPIYVRLAEAEVKLQQKLHG